MGFDRDCLKTISMIRAHCTAAVAYCSGHPTSIEQLHHLGNPTERGRHKTDLSDSAKTKGRMDNRMTLRFGQVSATYKNKNCLVFDGEVGAGGATY